MRSRPPPRRRSSRSTPVFWRPPTSSRPAPRSMSCNRFASTWATGRRFTREPGDALEQTSYGRACGTPQTPTGASVRIPESSALSAPRLARLAHVRKDRTGSVGDGSRAGSNDRRTNLVEALDRGDSMTSLATTQPGEHLQQPISRDVSVARGLLDRDDLLEMLDRAV